MASAQSSKLSREEFRRQRDLETARKEGTAPAALDEDGREINPHIPQYISQAPWYLQTNHPTLSHQKVPATHALRTDERLKASQPEWYTRGEKRGPAATKFRKGACENCGAMTHKTRDCVERPRKKGAKWTNTDIQADEVIQDIAFSWDGKRDRWAGHDTDAEFQKLVEDHQKIEEERHRIKDEEAERKLLEKSNTNSDGEKEEEEEEDEEESDHEEKYADKADMPGQKLDAKERVTQRNLRIREDTAKYLKNLDADSAHYDPKSRSIRDALNKDKKLDFETGDFYKNTGEAQKVAQMQLFAWDSTDKGEELNLQSEPSRAELLFKKHQENKEQVKGVQKESVLARYGGEAHLQAVPKELLLAQTEQYVEYSRTGKVIKGLERAIAKSRYPEDQMVGNHKAVFGSYWKDFQWGFACCQQFSKLAYCTSQ